jgi:hypothetical protein
LGGILSKRNIFDKLEKLLNDIEIEINKNNEIVLFSQHQLLLILLIFFLYSNEWE